MKGAVGLSVGLFVVLYCAVLSGADGAKSRTKPNIIVLIGDDLSPREFPSYDTGVWSSTDEEPTDKKHFRAKTPMLDKIAKEGIFFDKAWATPICAASRGMLMTGRYATITKWWYNFDYGSWTDGNGKVGDIVPLWITSPLGIAHLATAAGYGTFWGGRAGMKDVNNLDKFGFERGIFVPAPQEFLPSPLSDFQIVGAGVDEDGNKIFVNKDTGKVEPGARPQRSYTWRPHVLLLNPPNEDEQLVYYPNTRKTKQAYSRGTFGPDVDMEVTKKFMETCVEEDTPFFLYATSRIGHKAYDFINQKTDTWPPTPNLSWNASKEKYTKEEPVISKRGGKYRTKGINNGGIRRHVEYLDYTIWQYVEKCKELGVLDNTVIIFSTDNGTKGYGKDSKNKQRGPHVPMFIYAPGMNMTKQGRSSEFVSFVDIVPTVADLMGVSYLLDGYELHGQSLYKYLFRGAKKHTREYNFSYQTRSTGHKQLIRGSYVMKDGGDRWYDVSNEKRDLDSYPIITNWNKVPKELRDERDELSKVLDEFDVYETEHDYDPTANQKRKKRK
ncbi:hypothetical protein NDN08_000996 [Rhodosorus marinus]|uniref:Sulfatase N-terminal domain-containing protein n=1 Tax=Rhodosorus marinus TaxID=101924 RepID=A0AAV8UR37_9RHOD|nr:hypothetical protein NDN08_000996 [Rhodosorus marinus]